jgi:hypothetical protein
MDRNVFIIINYINAMRTEINYQTIASINEIMLIIALYHFNFNGKNAKEESRYVT